LALLIDSGDREFLRTHSFFSGYSIWSIIVVLFGSFGGLIVATVVSYTDNIIKGFATSCAIILTSVISYFIFHDLQFTMSFACGTAVVLISVFNYSEDMSKW
jgi:UDP-sugar transporter A1/2/3